MEKKFKYPRLGVHNSRMMSTDKMVPRGHGACPHCGNVYRSSNLKRHIRTHAEERPYKCKQCPMAFKQLAELGSHKSTHTAGKFSCQRCGEEYGDRPAYVKHLEMHTEGCFSCDQCGYNCTSQNLMSQHKLVHSDETKTVFVCKICSASFLQLKELNRHQEIGRCHVLKCDLCTYTTTSDAKFGWHIKGHEKQKKNKCTLCDYESYSKSSFGAHVKRHNLDYYERCSLCSYHPRNDYNLRTHLVMVHDGARNVKCEKCDEMFLTHMEMRGHKKIVHKRTDFQCVMCLRYYSGHSSLSQHRRTCKEVLVKTEFSDTESDPLALDDNIIDDDSMSAAEIEDSGKDEELNIKVEYTDEKIILES